MSFPAPIVCGVHMERRPDGSVVEIPDAAACSSCGRPFEVGLFTTSWWSCWTCPGTSGHRMYLCLRDGCRGATADPPHVGQNGPIADFG